MKKETMEKVCKGIGALIGISGIASTIMGVFVMTHKSENNPDASGIEIVDDSTDVSTEETPAEEEAE